MIGMARPFQSFNGRRRPRFESKNTAITILPTVRRRVNPCQRGFGYQKRRRLCQRKHGKRRVQKSNSHVYDYVPARSVDDIVEELVTKEQTLPSGSILPSPTRLTPFTEEVSSYFEEIADNFSNRLEGYSVQYQESSLDAETSKNGQCPKLSDNVTCANTLYAKNECWSIGQPDTDCENQALCCFNGCENVCFEGIEVIDASEVTNEVIQNSSSNSCPPVVSQPYCQTSRPNCWSAGTYDLDCPNSGLCCFDGCHNRCLEEIEEGKKQINERPTVPLYPTSEPKFPISENANDDDLPISTQRVPILVLHIYTPQQNEAKVQTNRVSENSAINNRVYQNEQ